MRLSNLIKEHNTIITVAPTLTTSSNNTSDASGLYSSNATNSGNSTYYFRGKVTNNYIKFAGLTWRIVRINEDGSIRIILENGFASTSFSQSIGTYSGMYYTNSTAKSLLENWYKTNLLKYSDIIIKGEFCEEARTKDKNGGDYVYGDANMIFYPDYSPSFQCYKDGNGYGPLILNIGLITYDEVVYAGVYNGMNNTDYYLFNNNYFWTMTPSGYNVRYTLVWRIYNSGTLYGFDITNFSQLRPVINLNANVLATGTGTSSDPYVIKTN